MALTAAIDLLMENHKPLTSTPRENLARLCDDGRLSAASSSLESLMTTLGLDADVLHMSMSFLRLSFTASPSEHLRQTYDWPFFSDCTLSGRLLSHEDEE
jgi:hypothetical protein